MTLLSTQPPIQRVPGSLALAVQGSRLSWPITPIQRRGIFFHTESYIDYSTSFHIAIQHADNFPFPNDHFIHLQFQCVSVALTIGPHILPASYCREMKQNSTKKNTNTLKAEKKMFSSRKCIAWSEPSKRQCSSYKLLTNFIARFSVLTAVELKSQVFWSSRCHWESGSRHVEESLCLHLQEVRSL